MLTSISPRALPTSPAGTFLGTPVTATVLTFPASGELDHPFARNPDGSPMQVFGAPGSQLVVLQLPFGSFAAGQTPADVTFNVAVAGTDAVGTALPPITATAGFAWGENPLGTPHPTGRWCSRRPRQWHPPPRRRWPSRRR